MKRAEDLRPGDIVTLKSKGEPHEGWEYQGGAGEYLYFTKLVSRPVSRETFDAWQQELANA